MSTAERILAARFAATSVVLASVIAWVYLRVDSGVGFSDTNRAMLVGIALGCIAVLLNLSATARRMKEDAE